ncbi:SGNH/GDSL hydrolase family protein [uncultured Limosilactobacillus sp.]|uniref:SGNH/GDSL hydrolase family protein n=1 Tax=uncultured Limosilactobacillus sp. TaxID=2837629 RepID=UPI0025EC8285|nr:SGNH/GDSL hydrolase family protein [uncultured Limosilactobacillus sp.]
MKKMAIIGDSITAGYDGHKNGPPVIAQTLARLANLEYTNLSVGGVSFGDSNGISGQVKQVNFKDYAYVLISMGINDYRFPHETIGNMQMVLQSGINKVKGDNPNIQIFLATPLQSWENGNGSLNQKNSMGVSQNDIDDMIGRVARLNGLKYLDWRDDPIVTAQNHTQTLGDGTVHPTAETQKKMGERFFQVFFDGQIVSDQPSNQPNNPLQPVQPVKPTLDIKLELIDTDSQILPTSNRNFTRIFRALQQITEAGSENSWSNDWQAQDFAYYNRACYDYLVNTVRLLKRQLDNYLSDNEVVDDDFNQLENAGLVVPVTLDLASFKSIMNEDFKKLEQVLANIEQSI